MPSLRPADLAPLWLRALDLEIGLAVRFAGIEQASFTALLYKARDTLHNPALGELGLVQPSDPPDEVWIIKKTTELSSDA